METESMPEFFDIFWQRLQKTGNTTESAGNQDYTPSYGNNLPAWSTSDMRGAEEKAMEMDCSGSNVCWLSKVKSPVL